MMQQLKGVQSILLAEDDEEDVEFFSMALQEVAKHIILTIATSEEGILKSLQHTIPDLLFLDSILIHIKGTECLTKIRLHSEYEKMPVIMYSGDINETKITEAFAAGANLYCVKPNSLNSVKDFLQNVLQMDWSDLSKIKPQYYYNNQFRDVSR
ncbi:MAG TPA: response regulator [Chitinophagaceae bacterium]|jgi:PleD family two-component response regulator|nr:response regulator [Chitinophagaceae bacterium]